MDDGVIDVKLCPNGSRRAFIALSEHHCQTRFASGSRRILDSAGRSSRKTKFHPRSSMRVPLCAWTSISPPTSTHSQTSQGLSARTPLLREMPRTQTLEERSHPACFILKCCSFGLQIRQQSYGWGAITGQDGQFSAKR